MKPVRSQAGFTLLEIMVVVVIIGILTAMIAPQILGESEKAMKTRVKADITALESALERYKLDNHTFPSSEQGLEALVQKPSTPPEPRNYPSGGGYIKRLPKDPWDNPYQYVFPGENGRGFDVFSLGADGQAGGDAENADIGNWNLDGDKG